MRHALAALLLAVSCIPAAAQQPGIRRFTVADGLPHSGVTHVYQDTSGYLWIATQEGVSRFDGRDFRNFGTDEGLARAFVEHIAEDRHGRLWFSVYDAPLHRLEDRPSTPGKTFSPVAGPAGRLKVSAAEFTADAMLLFAEDGIYRSTVTADGTLAPPFRLAAVAAQDGPQTARPGQDGRVWFVTAAELLVADGERIGRYPAGGVRHFVDVAEDAAGRAFAATETDVVAIDRHDGTLTPLVSVTGAQALHVDRAGTFWIGTASGLLHWDPRRGAPPQDVGGLSGHRVSPIAEDREGNIWAGAQGLGLIRISTDIASFTARDGTAGSPSHVVVSDPAGRIFAASATGVAEVGSGTVRPLPASDRPPFGAATRFVQIDADGDWWIGTTDGAAFMLPKGDFARPILVLRQPPTGAWPAPPIVVEGRAVWITGQDGPSGTLFRAVKTGSGVTLTRVDIPPIDRFGPISRVITTSPDTLWLSSHGGLARLRHGRIEIVQPQNGLPATMVRCLYRDSRGRLWLGLRYDGLSMTPDPNAAELRFENFSTRHGLGSNTVWSIAEDRAGRLVLGTGRGIDRFDPGNMAVHHYTTADGLAGTPVGTVLVDPRGSVWAATAGGVSTIPDRPAQPSALRAFITGVRIGGEPQPLPIRGTRDVAPIEIAASRRELAIEFVAPLLSGTGAQRYQYRLSGIDRDWTDTSERTVHYARLPAGRYTFVVRGIGAEGTPSADVATLQFSVMAPLWQRPWFVAIAILTVAAATFALYRYRLAHLLATERIRRQVALDLHDDVGSGLVQIAILSDVGLEEDPATAAQIWPRIGTLARSLRESMNDIVWAVDPRHDHLSAVVHRMKQVAYNALDSAGVKVDFRSLPDAALDRIALAADQRRHLLLIFKEAVANAARHSGASHVTIDLAPSSRALSLTVEDDGRGFDPSKAVPGHGLFSLQRRAAEMRGTLTVNSSPGNGTIVRLSVPI